ncbi:DMT family transporter [Rhizobium halophytocola]|uniref:Drug/metabolite transporter (DMT)-like permease n=1 Tax=Rhizobium halophytocola TaxID=735519 RepID=A0ABS4DSK8_9HYPH|nr:DMT family transporter [Rhizobium halophytocola]MBP1848665.1 drug/metabolite transporter (DMT)-like permease [Rhizobium halophytocola]
MTAQADLDPTDRHNSHARGSEKLRAHAAMLVFALMIASSFSIGGLATRYVAPTALQAIRYAIAVLVLVPVSMLAARQPVRLPKEPHRFIVLGLLMAVYMVTMFVALRFTKPVATGAVFTLMPLLSAGFAWLLMRQRTRFDVLISLILAAVGAVWVIFRGDLHALLSFNVGRGELIYFVGVTCHAIYVPLLRLFNRGEPPLVFMLWAVLATLGFIALSAVPALAAIDVAAVPWLVWAAAVYLAIATTVITFFLLQYASLRLPAPKVLAYGYLTPTFIIILEGLLGHGWAGASVFAGALVTAGGLVLMATLPD